MAEYLIISIAVYLFSLWILYMIIKTAVKNALIEVYNLPKPNNRSNIQETKGQWIVEYTEIDEKTGQTKTITRQFFIKERAEEVCKMYNGILIDKSKK